MTQPGAAILFHGRQGRATLQGIKHPVSQSLYGYWNTLRAGRIAPRRFEIEPASIGPILPDTLILERIDVHTSRFRLAGTRVSEAFGREFRGLNLLELFNGDDRTALQVHLATSARQGAAIRTDIHATTDTGLGTTFEMLLLPLTHTRDVIDRYVGCIAPFERPPWFGAVALTRQHILLQELIWPNGDDAAFADAARQSPFMPHVREARIVRADRRQFRVYDGGRRDE